jgi:hypothetical protein
LHGTTLVRLEVDERSGYGVHGIVARLDTHFSVYDEQERGLLHAVVAERLAGAQSDEDGALGAVPRMEDDGRPGAVRGLDLLELPVAHMHPLPSLRGG